LDLPVPAVELRLPSEDRRAYWTAVQTTTELPRSAPVRYDRGGCFLYSGVAGVHARGWRGSRVMAGAFDSWLLTQYRRKWINHRFRRSSLTKPHQKFTFVHPSDLPLARRAWMVQARLGLHPSAFARFVTWRLQGSGTGLDTGRSMTTSHAHSSWCNIASQPPLGTGRAPFRRIQLEHWTRFLRSTLQSGSATLTTSQTEPGSAPLVLGRFLLDTDVLPVRSPRRENSLAR